VADKGRNQQEQPYSKPTLTVYGKITELTAIVGTKRGKDSQVPHSTTKTAVA
jgi:hypothetical protein